MADDAKRLVSGIWSGIGDDHNDSDVPAEWIDGYVWISDATPPVLWSATDHRRGTGDARRSTRHSCATHCGPTGRGGPTLRTTTEDLIDGARPGTGRRSLAAACRARRVSVTVTEHVDVRESRASVLRVRVTPTVPTIIGGLFAVGAIVARMSTGRDLAEIYALAFVVSTAGLGFALDDPAAETVAASPTPLARRRIHRVAIAVTITAATWLIIAAVVATSDHAAVPHVRRRHRGRRTRRHRSGHVGARPATHASARRPDRGARRARRAGVPVRHRVPRRFGLPVAGTGPRPARTMDLAGARRFRGADADQSRSGRPAMVRVTSPVTSGIRR